MARPLRAQQIARMVEDSDWENSDASSDDEDYSLLASTQPDPLKQAECTAESDEEHEETTQPVTMTPQTSPTDSTNSEVTNSIPEAPCDSTVTSSALSTMQFSEPVGPAIEMGSTATALDFFNITFGNDRMELIVEQTNLYAERNPPSARYKWYDTTVSEMYLFLGIIIAMGVHFLPSFADYWSSDSLLGVPGICAGMHIDHFKALLHCMHINDNTKAVPRSQPGYDRLHKLRPMIQRLRETWRTCYHPPQEQSKGFKGRSAMKQYMPMKPTKRGFKVWCRCSPNGLINDCEVYECFSEQSRERSLSTSVVLRLAKFIYNKGHHLFYDNYFSSIELAQELLRNNTYCCGTARSNRRLYPSSLKWAVLERGQHKSEMVGDVHCFVWRDKNNIDFIQTICPSNEQAQVMCKNKDGSRTAVACPLAMKLHNENMGGVDLADSKRQVYTCSRKAKKWWHHLFTFS